MNYLDLNGTQNWHLSIHHKRKVLYLKNSKKYCFSLIFLRLNAITNNEVIICKIKQINDFAIFLPQVILSRRCRICIVYYYLGRY